MAKRIHIDADLLEVSAEYIKTQLSILEQFRTPRTLSDVEMEDMVYRCAIYPQECRNLQIKLDQKFPERRVRFLEPSASPTMHAVRCARPDTARVQKVYSRRRVHEDTCGELCGICNADPCRCRELNMR